ncbi:hypothetical protein [Thaumasiovibrio subtropicus]|uniref:hypothetical protein n=1 Tax=Thaumasiovibrio subtropicus TaxID=1891207 RepID=UPI000B354A6B|nr:hypothetical protein [Thaumasiovibrio subtropicus]
MASRLKRISYSIFLDPLNNPSDLYASQIMHQWAKARQAPSSNQSTLEKHNAIHVHKQVYLSGLFLHLLSPEMTQRLSLQLTEEQITPDTLFNTLEGAGLEPLRLMESDKSEGHDTLLSRIGALLERQRQDTDAHFDGIVSKISDSLDTRLGKTAERDCRQLVQQLDKQTSEIAELKKTVNELKAALSEGSSVKPQRKETQVVDDLNTRLKHVQKLKKKGIF